MPSQYKTKHELYGMWKGMWQRCTNPNHEKYKHYGGRGITVCETWKDFWVFVSDVGPRPEGYLLERENNDASYSKDNCLWAPYSVQARNKRNNIKTTDGIAVDSSIKLGGNRSLVQQRINNLGWALEKAITTPVRKKPRQQITIEGVTDTPTGWARRLGISQSRISYYVNKLGAENAVKKFLMEQQNAVQK